MENIIIDEKLIDIKQLVCRRILRSIDKVDDGIWKIIAELSNHPSCDVRNDVAYLLSKIGHLRPMDALNILSGMVPDDPWVLETVALSVGEIGSIDPPTSLNILKIIAEDNSFWVRKNVVSSAIRLLSLDIDFAIKEMKLWSTDSNRYVREAAALILGKIDINVDLRIKMLKAMCLDKYSDVRRAALLSLVHLYNGKHTKEIIDILLVLSKDSYWRIREIAAQSIGRIARDTPSECRMILETLIYDGIGPVRKAAATSLGNLVATGVPGYLPMAVALINESAFIHPDVLEILARTLGKPARISSEISIELLYKLGQDEDLRVKSAVRDSLLQLQRRPV